MMITVEPNEAEVLREILQDTLTELRFESARTDTHDYRELLHQRERVVEALLAKFPDEKSRSMAALTGLGL